MRLTNTGAAIALSLALCAGACGRPQVTDPAERTERALDPANILDVDAGWDDDFANALEVESRK